MTDHLPECFANLCLCDEKHFDVESCDYSCICPALRACEQRVREDGLYVSGVNVGYESGLRRAREVVAALIQFPQPVTPTMNDALAAIDALREGEK